MAEQRFLRNPDTVCRQAAGGFYLLNTDNGSLQGINETGLLIWRMLTHPLTAAETVSRLEKSCSAEADGAKKPVGDMAVDVDLFLEALRRNGFIGPVLGAPAEAEMLPPPSPVAASKCEPGETNERSIYRGRSMLGTFRPGDALVLEPTPLAAIRPGDVVIFRGSSPAGDPVDVVHRVISLSGAGLVTRGDANRVMDNEPVRAENLRGRVSRLERDGRSLRVAKGPLALLLVQLRRSGSTGWLVIKRMLRAAGRRPYRCLRQSGLVRRLWRPEVVLLALPTYGEQVGGKGWFIKYVHKQRTVAWWRPGLKHFRCRKPYDLVLSSPKNE